MTTTLQTSPVTQTQTRRPFSLRLFLLIVFALSWPPQIAYALWGNDPVSGYLLSSLSMVMVMVGAFIAGRWVFRDGFKNMGWRWGKPMHYAAVLSLALFIFGAPVLLETLLGLNSLPENISAWTILGNFLTSFALTLIPGFGEEFGWRAYLLPRLAQRHSLRKALLLHAFIWWAWHIPALVKIGSQVKDANTNPWLPVAVTLIISLLPAMMNAILFAYVWKASRSLAVAGVYHSAYDEVRDALQRGIGFGPLVSIWEMAVTLIFGAVLLWKADWSAIKTEMAGNNSVLHNSSPDRHL
ncbi:MAG: CPBP family intramembrane metalloprotease [Anaerolineaceae bacterium]|nr:CPBP family intramembrane metalloprotease [Anaerolineaceae bacterium]